MKIDSHQHLWTADYAWLAEPGLAALRRDFTVADLRHELARSGIDATVLVEAGQCHADETLRFLEIAEATPQIAGVVGWASLTDPDLSRTLAGFRAAPGGRWLVGVRDQVQGVIEPGYLARSDVRDALATIGAAGLTFDLVVRSSQIPACTGAVAATPDTMFVLDHLGKPRIDAAGWSAWRAAVAPLAACDNVVAKLSGLLTEAGPQWSVGAITPFVATALELFGPERLMFGSDWPVCTLVASYADTMAALDACLSELSPTERAAIHGDTAVRVYGLENDQ